jgi:hypothetical protein
MERHLRLCEIFESPRAPIKDNIVFYKYKKTLLEYKKVVNRAKTPLERIRSEQQIKHLQKRAIQQFNKIKNILDNNHRLQEYMMKNW